MAPRKVIADSEDEDEGESVSLPSPGGEFDRPEPEPLSPHGRSSSPVAFAVQQSTLIENIVRQSQRASAVSSGDVSLPAKKTGARVNPSSGTDVTSPRRLSKSRNHATLLSDDTSALTTPRQSTGQEWEIPSSPEDATAPHSVKNARSKGTAKIASKDRRSELSSSTIATEMLPADDATATTNTGGITDRPRGGSRTGSAPTSAPKKTQLSYHDSIPLETTSFYVAQSTLTTMQKLEYEKVNISLNNYGGHPGSLGNQKSSGTTTIRYPTPRGYSPASPLSWEGVGAQPSSPRRNETIHISSSPDVIGFGCDPPNEKSPIVGLETGVLTVNHEPPGKPQSRTPIGRGKKRRAQDDEEDELCQEDVYNPDDLDLPQNYYRPRATKRRSAGSAGLSVAKDNKEVLAADLASELPLHDASSGIGNQLQDDHGFPAPPLPDTDPPEPPREELPKKRGRKRKQPVIDTTPAPRTETNQDSYLDQNPASPTKELVTEPSPVKPKKKRGRPRKSESSKATDEPPPEPPTADERPRIASPRSKGNADKSTAGLQNDADSKESVEEEEEESKTSEEDVGDAALKDGRPPLKEVNSNLKTPSKPDPTGTSPTKPAAELDIEKSTPKAQVKENPKPGISQSKATYRVGLSRRSRIAPLLKSIKK